MRWGGWFTPPASPRVLLFHRVADLPSDPCRLAVPPRRFRAQLEALAAGHDFVASDVRAARRRGRRPRLAITFDDGFADNLDHALPILESLGIPATFFITSGAVGSGREFWWTELERLLLQPARLPDRLVVDGPVSEDHDLRGDPGVPWGGHPEWTLDQTPPGARHALFAALATRLHAAPVGEREALLQALRRALGEGEAGRPDHLPLTREALGRLAASPCAAVGAHTQTHPRLAGLPVEEQEAEIAGSKSAIESMVGRSVMLFAYPYGSQTDYDENSCRAVQRAGFTHAFGNHGSLPAGGLDPFRIPRLCVLDWDPAELLARLAKFA